MNKIKNNTIVRMSAALGAALAFILAACGDPGGGAGSPPPPPAMFEVKFMTNGASLGGGVTDMDFNAANPQIVQVNNGAALGYLPVPPAHTLNNYEFAGWYANSASTGERVTKDTIITANVSFYAKWLAKAGKSFITLDVNSDGYSPDPAFSGNYVFAVTTNQMFNQTPPLPSRSGDWHFAGWYDTAARTGGTMLDSTTIVSADVTYYARWFDTVAYDDSGNPKNNWNQNGPVISRLRAESSASLRLEWNAPTQTGVQNIEILESTTANSGDAHVVPASRISGNPLVARQVTITGLTNGQSYYYWIRAARNYTKTAPSATSQNATALGQAEPHVSARGSNNFIITWAAVAGATHYDVYVNAGANLTSGATKKGQDLSVLTYTESGIVSQATTYYLWVVAKNASGYGAFVPIYGDAAYGSAVLSPAVTDGYAQRTLSSVTALTMPVKRAYDDTLNEFNGAAGIDWRGLTIRLDYEGSDPDVDISWSADDTRFSITGVTFNNNPVYSKPPAPGTNLILNAQISFTEDGVPHNLNLASGALAADSSRYLFVANLPAATYYKADENRPLMVDVPAPASGLVDMGLSVAAWSPNFWDAAANPVSVVSFKIARFETTERFYAAVKSWANDNRYAYVRGGANYTLPNAASTTSLTPCAFGWYSSVVFCNALSEMTGKQPVYVDSSGAVIRDPNNIEASAIEKKAGANGYRLPTEVEWEFAARGGVPSSTTPWNFLYAGSDIIDEVAVTMYNSEGVVANVGSKQPNSLYLYDMSGNEAEWADFWFLESDELWARYWGGSVYLFDHSGVMTQPGFTRAVRVSTSTAGLRLAMNTD